MDDRMSRLRELGIRPIVGFVHHGSGPRHTSLLDPRFAEKLCAFATQFAARYPWVDSYTPVNEPHTTARFSGMYGVWYPHGRSRREYLLALLHQLKAVVLSMQAIRHVRGDARLVQTDDVGNISGTEELRSTWELLNERQWLAYDLLCGTVDSHHSLFAYISSAGIPERDIRWFAEHPCPPDVLGVNYYVTSDRFLDHRLGLYPESRRSAEGDFADVEAVRVHRQGLAGVDLLLSRAWQRYRKPVAITEVHLGCTVDEQIRWLTEIWHGAMRARAHGRECVAITPWALLGSFYWNELVTRENGHYEPGVFDLRRGRPEPTELAQVVAQIAAGVAPQHPALTHTGWWRHQNRVCFPFGEEIAA
jgi:beta-glucosidase/6-phospho-beta-glucosidase/beta-galactosidase